MSKKEEISRLLTLADDLEKSANNEKKGVARRLHESASKKYEEATNMAESHLGLSHKTTLEIRDLWATSLHAAGDWTAAITCNRENIKRYSQLPGDHGDSILESQRRLGIAYFNNEQWSDATKIYETISRTVSDAKKSAQDVCRSHVDLAAALYKSKKPANIRRAVDLNILALRQTEQDLGKDHMEAVKIRYNVGIGLLRVEKYEDARDMLEKNLAVLKQKECKAKSHTEYWGTLRDTQTSIETCLAAIAKKDEERRKQLEKERREREIQEENQQKNRTGQAAGARHSKVKEEQQEANQRHADTKKTENNRQLQGQQARKEKDSADKKQRARPQQEQEKEKAKNTTKVLQTENSSSKPKDPSPPTIKRAESFEKTTVTNRRGNTNTIRPIAAAQKDGENLKRPRSASERFFRGQKDKEDQTETSQPKQKSEKNEQRDVAQAKPEEINEIVERWRAGVFRERPPPSSHQRHYSEDLSPTWKARAKNTSVVETPKDAMEGLKDSKMMSGRQKEKQKARRNTDSSSDGIQSSEHDNKKRVQPGEVRQNSASPTNRHRIPETPRKPQGEQTLSKEVLEKRQAQLVSSEGRRCDDPAPDQVPSPLPTDVRRDKRKIDTRKDNSRNPRSGKTSPTTVSDGGGNRSKKESKSSDASPRKSESAQKVSMGSTESTSRSLDSDNQRPVETDSKLMNTTKDTDPIPGEEATCKEPIAKPTTKADERPEATTPSQSLPIIRTDSMGSNVTFMTAPDGEHPSFDETAKQRNLRKIRSIDRESSSSVKASSLTSRRASSVEPMRTDSNAKNRASRQRYNEQDAILADEWFENLRKEAHALLDKYQDDCLIDRKDRPVKIAILDSGVAKDTKMGRVPPLLKGRRVKVGKQLALSLPWNIDTKGHGTHAAGLILEVCPYADLYVYRILQGDETINKSYVTEALADAIDKKVDIVSMSFGWDEDSDPDLRAVIGRAKDNNVLLFAASSNNGIRTRGGMAYPARALEVIAVDAADGLGNPSKFNPPQKRDKTRFTALGEAVKSTFPMHLGDGSGLERMSGTSCATPIVAATAGLILEFARQRPLCHDTSIEGYLKSVVGMRQVLLECFSSKHVESSHFNHVDPVRLFRCNENYKDGGDWSALFSPRLNAAMRIVQCLQEEFGPDVGSPIDDALQEESRKRHAGV